ncbi:MAG: inositol monophosphatase [Sphingomonadales bacterium]|nr:inositol monophosphatase [Sphingomonadales bacterium]
MSHDLLTRHPSLLGQVQQVARPVAEFQCREWSTFNRGAIEYKGAHDLVTYVDRTSEEMLVSGLSALLPEAGFLTEEGTIETIIRPLMWVVDPLDGTTNFTHGLPFFSISIALLCEGTPLLGMVWEPIRGERFTAAAGQGCALNDQPVRVSPTCELDQALLATGFPYEEYSRVDDYLPVFRRMVTESRGIRRLGSAAIDLAYVACGRFDGYFEYNLSPWDVAAGVLLVNEAGGRVTDFQGGNNSIFGQQIIASNPLLHPQILSRLGPLR